MSVMLDGKGTLNSRDGYVFGVQQRRTAGGTRGQTVQHGRDAAWPLLGSLELGPDQLNLLLEQRGKAFVKEIFGVEDYDARGKDRGWLWDCFVPGFEQIFGDSYFEGVVVV